MEIFWIHLSSLLLKNCVQLQEMETWNTVGSKPKEFFLFQKRVLNQAVLWCPWWVTPFGTIIFRKWLSPLSLPQSLSWLLRSRHRLHILGRREKLDTLSQLPLYFLRVAYSTSALVSLTKNLLCDHTYLWGKLEYPFFFYSGT